MASFNTLELLIIPDDYEGKLLVPGAVYLPGHDVTGLTAAEAAELLTIAPEGTFQPLDAEAGSVVDWYTRKFGSEA